MKETKYCFILKKDEEILFEKPGDLHIYKGKIYDAEINIFEPDLSTYNIEVVDTVYKHTDKKQILTIQGSEEKGIELHQPTLKKGTVVEIGLENIVKMVFDDVLKAKPSYTAEKEEVYFYTQRLHKFAISVARMKEIINKIENNSIKAILKDEVKQTNVFFSKLKLLDKTYFLKGNDVFLSGFNLIINKDILFPSKRTYIINDSNIEIATVMKVTCQLAEIENFEDIEYLYKSFRLQKGCNFTYHLNLNNKYITKEEIFPKKKDLQKVITALETI